MIHAGKRLLTMWLLPVWGGAWMSSRSPTPVLQRSRCLQMIVCHGSSTNGEVLATNSASVYFGVSAWRTSRYSRCSVIESLRNSDSLSKFTKFSQSRVAGECGDFRLDGQSSWAGVFEGLYWFSFDLFDDSDSSSPVGECSFMERLDDFFYSCGCSVELFQAESECSRSFGCAFHSFHSFRVCCFVWYFMWLMLLLCVERFYRWP